MGIFVFKTCNDWLPTKLLHNDWFVLSNDAEVANATQGQVWDASVFVSDQWNQHIEETSSHKFGTTFGATQHVTKDHDAREQNTNLFLSFDHLDELNVMRIDEFEIFVRQTERTEKTQGSLLNHRVWVCTVGVEYRHKMLERIPPIILIGEFGQKLFDLLARGTVLEFQMSHQLFDQFVLDEQLDTLLGLGHRLEERKTLLDHGQLGLWRLEQLVENGHRVRGAELGAHAIILGQVGETVCGALLHIGSFVCQQLKVSIDC
mmetsp:Transcript_15915/g.47802  ORF Transcript_15915/g.47802 Transcript_15915/m.47802 type:complete len:261 (+) Transcript_15915:2411-3193(+)